MKKSMLNSVDKVQLSNKIGKDCATQIYELSELYKLKVFEVLEHAVAFFYKTKPDIVETNAPTEIENGSDKPPTHRGRRKRPKDS